MKTQKYGRRKKYRYIYLTAAACAFSVLLALRYIFATVHHGARSDVYTRNQIRPKDNLLVQYGDLAYSLGDLSPIVIEEYKLVLIVSAKCGCTNLKMLARRMSGFKNYRDRAFPDGRPFLHNTERNGLTYLFNFDRKRASEIMTSPQWTRAVFVRDPKERFLSAYLDKAVNENFYLVNHCCKDKKTCGNYGKISLNNFYEIVKTCSTDNHWRAQSKTVDEKYWPYVNFVGHLETARADIETLLRRVNAWDKYGKSGWGAHMNETIFDLAKNEKDPGRHHATSARTQMKKYYTPEMERKIEQLYIDDYNNPNLKLDNIRIN